MSFQFNGNDCNRDEANQCNYEIQSREKLPQKKTYQLGKQITKNVYISHVID